MQIEELGVHLVRYGFEGIRRRLGLVRLHAAALHWPNRFPEPIDEVDLYPIRTVFLIHDPGQQVDVPLRDVLRLGLPVRRPPKPFCREPCGGGLQSGWLDV